MEERIGYTYTFGDAIPLARILSLLLREKGDRFAVDEEYLRLKETLGFSYRHRSALPPRWMRC